MHHTNLVVITQLWDGNIIGTRSQCTLDYSVVWHLQEKCRRMEEEEGKERGGEGGEGRWGKVGEGGEERWGLEGHNSLKGIFLSTAIYSCHRF